MAGSVSQWSRRVLRGAFYLFVFVVTAASLSPVRELWDEILGPPNAQLLIVTSTPLTEVTVNYEGRVIGQRPDPWSRRVQDYAAYPDMRARTLRPTLLITWEGPNGAASVSQTMRQFDSGRICLYVLRLDATGVPIAPEPRDEFSPFWWTCGMR
jgi:hypothetical protein